ncbi:MAG: hypothetical protein EXQ70_03505 [Solirubrobacterales bacterium]|nr:hypothetical protein [Solirubrobacterales bacterium]
MRLPRGAERPIRVFINGVEQRDGEGYSIHGAEIVFSRPIIKERVSRARWIVMLIGLFGSYEPNETIDIHYRHGGETRVLEDAPVLPD